MFRLLTLTAMFVASVTFGGPALAGGHYCNYNKAKTIAQLTDPTEYGEILVATGEASDGTFSFYAEPAVGRGGLKTLDRRTMTLLRSAPHEGAICLMAMGVDFSILPESKKKTYAKGFVSTLVAMASKTTAFLIIVNPDTGEWKFIRADNVGEPNQTMKFLINGTDFVLLVDTDPEPISDPDGSPAPWGNSYQ